MIAMDSKHGKAVEFMKPLGKLLGKRYQFPCTVYIYTEIGSGDFQISRVLYVDGARL